MGFLAHATLSALPVGEALRHRPGLPLPYHSYEDDRAVPASRPLHARVTSPRALPAAQVRVNYKAYVCSFLPAPVFTFRRPLPGLLPTGARRGWTRTKQENITPAVGWKERLLDRAAAHRRLDTIRARAATVPLSGSYLVAARWRLVPGCPLVADERGCPVDRHCRGGQARRSCRRYTRTLAPVPHPRRVPVRGSSSY